MPQNPKQAKARKPLREWSVYGRGLLAFMGLTMAFLGSDSRFVWPMDNSGVVARVNGQPISVEQIDHAAARLLDTSGTARPELSQKILSTAEKQAVITLLIDEELLLQRAETMTIASADPGIRKALAQAAIDQVVAEALAQPVSDAQLQQFYQQYRSLFSQPARIALQAYRFTDLFAAQQAYKSANADSDWEPQRLQHIPTALLPHHMLRRYLGPALTELALTLNAGELSNPISRSDGVYLLKVTAVQPLTTPLFDDIRPQVIQEFKRRSRDWALQQKLADLREEAHIRSLAFETRP
ncbi:MAG: peptidylprolyl isomerase [Alphaproteobacteria bacterium]|nr:peptidylprolyl isomerase [Alphaproteobacteria bacterium]